MTYIHHIIIWYIDIDECSLGTHHCGDVGNCVDTEGGYDCLSAQLTTTDPTTIARVSTPGVMTHSTTLSTSITAVGTKTTSTASTSASTVQSASLCLVLVITVVLSLILRYIATMTL